MKTHRKLLVAGAAVAALGFAPAAASAALTDTQLPSVGGTVVDNLSLAVATPAVLNISHAADATSTSLVTVTSTMPSWTLSVQDNNAATNAGHLVKVTGTGPTALTDALQWSANGTDFTDLSGSPATVKTGSLIGTATVTYKQPALPAADTATSGATYSLSALYTVTG